MLFARAGGSLGPYLVGVLSGRHVPVGRLFVLGTIPLAIGAVAAIAITVIYRAHFHMKNKSALALPVVSARLETERPPSGS
jgi:hypothetical protein